MLGKNGWRFLLAVVHNQKQNQKTTAPNQKTKHNNQPTQNETRSSRSSSLPEKRGETDQTVSAAYSLHLQHATQIYYPAGLIDNP